MPLKKLRRMMQEKLVIKFSTTGGKKWRRLATVCYERQLMFVYGGLHLVPALALQGSAQATHQESSLHHTRA
jgi:hypothetical protein